MSTQSVGIREAKAHLSKYLQRIKLGHEIILTDRGRPVGKLVPISPEELSLANRLRLLEEKGLIDPASSELNVTPHPITLPTDLAQRLLQEDRGE